MINNFKDYSIVEMVASGASSVEKYKLIKNNKYYLLRLFDIRFMSSRYIALENMELLSKNNINVPKVYDKGIFNDKKGYALIEWVDGISLEDKLLTVDDEINYGKISAIELRKMHSIKTSFQQSEYENLLRKFQRKIEKLNSLNLSISDLDILKKYVEYNIDIFKENNTNSIIHGDFHPGNLVVNNNNNITFIDMDVCKISHPWHDLSSNACNMEYPNFYSSVITNYFDEHIPDDFWKVYNVFGCYYVLDYILYSLRTNGKTIDDGNKKLIEFLNYTNGLRNEIPSWYNKKINSKEKRL